MIDYQWHIRYSDESLKINNESDDNSPTRTEKMNKSLFSEDSGSKYFKVFFNFGTEPSKHFHYVGNSIKFKKSSFSSVTEVEQDDSSSKDSECERLLYLLKEELYEDGCLSKVDLVVENILASKGDSYVVELLNTLAFKCQSSGSEHAYMHFLNVLKNVLYHVNYKKLILIPFAAMSFDNIYVQESAISVFEGIDYVNEQDVTDVINALGHVSKSSSKWINVYRDKVIEELESYR